MKVGFPLNEKGASVLGDDFHGCKLIGVYNTDTQSFKEYSISDIEAQSENADLFSVLKSLDINFVVCNKMKPMALKYFSYQHITVFKAQGSLVRLNAELLINDKLEQFNGNMTDVSGCSGSCSSCGSSDCSSDSTIFE